MLCGAADGARLVGRAAALRRIGDERRGSRHSDAAGRRSPVLRLRLRRLRQPFSARPDDGRRAARRPQQARVVSWRWCCPESPRTCWRSRLAPAVKLLGLDLGGARPFDSWWLLAAVTYTLSGVVAGAAGRAVLVPLQRPLSAAANSRRDLHRDRRHRYRRQPGHATSSPAPSSRHSGRSGRTRSSAATSCSSIRASLTPARTARRRFNCHRGDEIPRAALLDTVREVMRAWYIDGSDPGLAVAAIRCPTRWTAFAARAKTDVVSQSDARAVADRAGCHLEGLGGTEQGIIGALAAIALVAGGDDGRVVHVDEWPWPDDFRGPQPVAAIAARGVAEIRTASGEAFVGRGRRRRQTSAPQLARAGASCCSSRRADAGSAVARPEAEVGAAQSCETAGVGAWRVVWQRRWPGRDGFDRRGVRAGASESRRRHCRPPC